MLTAPTTNATWQVQAAKNRFSEVIDRALKDGPQTITRHGRSVVYVVSVDTVSLHTKSNATADGFADFLLSAPRAEDFELPVRRSRQSPVQLGN